MFANKDLFQDFSDDETRGTTPSVATSGANFYNASNTGPVRVQYTSTPTKVNGGFTPSTPNTNSTVFDSLYSPSNSSVQNPEGSRPGTSSQRPGSAMVAKRILEHQRKQILAKKTTIPGVIQGNEMHIANREVPGFSTGPVQEDMPDLNKLDLDNKKMEETKEFKSMVGNFDPFKNPSGAGKPIKIKLKPQSNVIGKKTLNPIPAANEPQFVATNFVDDVVPPPREAQPENNYRSGQVIETYDEKWKEPPKKYEEPPVEENQYSPYKAQAQPQLQQQPQQYNEYNSGYGAGSFVDNEPNKNAKERLIKPARKPEEFENVVPMIPLEEGMPKVPPYGVIKEKERAKLNHEQVNRPMFDPVEVFIQKLKSPQTSAQEKAAMFMNPLPKEVGMLQCSIERDKKGFNKIYPKYRLILSDEHQTVLLTGKKRSINKTSNYLITSDQNNLTKKGAGYLGKLRSNFMGTEFVVYDSGEKPSKKIADERLRKQMGAILYQSNILGSRGPRKMKVFLPEVDVNGEARVFRPRDKKDGILQRVKNEHQNSGTRLYINKPPKWNETVQAFVLNFNGRVDKASVKNFQLIDEEDDNQILLQFGRVGKTLFNMDFQYPFSIFQAFAISLSSFDFKFACE